MLPVQFPKTGPGLVLLGGQELCAGGGNGIPVGPRVTWPARVSPQAGETASFISPWDPGCLESGDRGPGSDGFREVWKPGSQQGQDPTLMP